MEGRECKMKKMRREQEKGEKRGRGNKTQDKG